MRTSSQDERPWQNKETLESLYIEQDNSIREIAEELGCGRRTVTNWLYRTEVKEPKGNEPYHDGERLKKLYVEERLSYDEIAEQFDCSDLTIQRWLARHGITREKVDASEAPWRDKDRIYTLYSGLGLTCREAGEILGCSHDCARRWLHKFDIEIKDPKYREWEVIRRLRDDDSLTTQQPSGELEVPQRLLNDKTPVSSGKWLEIYLPPNTSHPGPISRGTIEENSTNYTEIKA